MILGADLAGVVESVGDDTTRFAPGDLVFGQLLIAPLGSAGTYAEYVAVNQDANLARLPEPLVRGGGSMSTVTTWPVCPTRCASSAAL
ncbi:MAG: hypothetical protein M3069_25015 [Chloroflexota bacterium]|nr:hypothetical protein [Chloroflexota bacterium]